MKKPSKSKNRQNQTSTPNINLTIQGNSDGSNNVIGDNNIVSISSKAIKLPSLYQLPSKVADFIGRKVLVDEILQDFEKNNGATISGLTGMGGIGKTALGLEIAYRLAQNYSDGQIFLDLKGTTSPLSSIDIMRHVILSFEPTADLRVVDEANLLRVYRSVLHDKKVLLYFDNARSSEQISNLQPPSSSCTMIVTSRWVFPLAGLNTYKIGIFKEDEASEFLIELCPRINKEESNALARACGYLPLALRIAGSFLQVNNDWQVDQYIERLLDSKKRLIAFQESLKEADMSDEFDLISTFDMSYNQLSNHEQRYWRMLSVFPVSFEWEAAMTIWEIEEKEAKRLLGIFKRYSLIEFNEPLLRYEFHDLLNEFARTKIRNSEAKLVKNRHAIYYSEVIDAITMFAFTGEDNFIPALRALDIEWENINAGFWFATSKNSVEFLKAVIVYARPLDVLKLRHHPLEMIRWSTIAVGAARKLNDLHALAGHFGDLGIIYLDLGEIDKSIECHEKSLAIAKKINDEKIRDLLTSNALGNIGQAYEDKGKYELALQNYEAALTLSRKHNNIYSEAMDLLNLGNIKSKIGEIDEATKYVLKSKDLFNQLGNLGKAGSCLLTLGNIYTRLQRMELALDHLEQAKKIFIEIGDIHNLGACIQNIGNVYMEMDKPDIALDNFKEAMNIATISSDPIGASQRLINIGSALFRSQKPKESIPYFEKGIAIAKDIGAHDVVFLAVRNLSTVYIELQNQKKAEETVAFALSIFQDDPTYLTRVMSLQRHINLFNARPWNELSETEQVLWIVGQVKLEVEAKNTKNAEKNLSDMISNIKASPEFQELGRVLKKYIDGEKEIDMSSLPHELANIIQSELDIK